MYTPNNSSNYVIYSEQTNLVYTTEILRAYVDTIIPRSPELAELFGIVQYYGAIDFQVEQFLVISLYNYSMRIADPTALLLDEAAQQLLRLNNEIIPSNTPIDNVTFSHLNSQNRLRAIALLYVNNFNTTNLKAPFYNDPDLVLSVTNTILRLCMMGYYSEWYGYGTTRLAAPDERKLEFYPLSWEQIGYLGPSLGYRALRVNNFLSK